MCKTEIYGKRENKIKIKHKRYIGKLWGKLPNYIIIKNLKWFFYTE